MERLNCRSVRANGWGTIFNVSSGAPPNASARNSINRTGTPDIVGKFLRDGELAWGSTSGNFFSERRPETERSPHKLCCVLNDQAEGAFKWTNGRAAQIIIVNYLI